MHRVAGQVQPHPCSFPVAERPGCVSRHPRNQHDQQNGGKEHWPANKPANRRCTLWHFHLESSFTSRLCHIPVPDRAPVAPSTFLPCGHELSKLSPTQNTAPNVGPQLAPAAYLFGPSRPQAPERVRQQHSTTSPPRFARPLGRDPYTTTRTNFAFYRSASRHPI